MEKERDDAQTWFDFIIGPSTSTGVRDGAGEQDAEDLRWSG